MKVGFTFFRALTLTFVLSSPLLAVESGLKGGLPVAEGHYPELVLTRSNGITCTGTIVGPQAVLMAAHCIHPKSPLVTFYYKDVLYHAFGIPSEYAESRGHDMAIAVTFKEMKPGVPASLLTASLHENVVVRLLSYHCDENGNTNTDFEVLRMGDTNITKMGGLFINVNTPAMTDECFAHSGAPAISYTATDRYVAALSTYNPARGESRLLRMDTMESRALYQRVAKVFNAKVCGFNLICENHMVVEP